VAGPLPQQREQELVRAFFGGADDGFFVQVGANHPTENSLSWPLETAGWTGVLVEPQPDLAAFLVTARKAKVFAAACTAPDHAGRSLPVAGGARAYVVMVPTRTLDSILAEAEAPTPIDLIALAVGGQELEALLGFDFGRWRPRLILLEDHVVDLEKRRFLGESGYRLLRHVGNNGWYVPADSPAKASEPERREIMRKYVLALPLRMLGNALRVLFRRLGNWWSVR
jgi:hypothetical protein